MAKRKPKSRFDVSCVDVIDMLEALGIENVNQATEDEVNFCVSPDAGILTADLHWVPAGDLVEGDQLWAFDEYESETSHGRRWRRAEVTATSRRFLPSSRVYLSDGTSVVVSDDHQWLVDRNGKSPEWRRTRDLNPGKTRLIRLTHIWRENRSKDSGWLAGIFDGEVDLEGVQMRRIDSPQVVAVESLGEQEVVALGTSTSTFVCDGLASHNSCPFPGHSHGDSSPSAYMNIASTAWMCQGCKRKGNAVTFLSDYGKLTHMDAVYFLKQRYGGTDPDPDTFSVRDELERRRKQREREAKKNMPLNVVIDEKIGRQFTVNWHELEHDEDRPEWANYILDRGFTPETLTDWEVGYSKADDRITICVRNEHGQLSGFKGRSWRAKHKPRYLVLGKGKWEKYHISEVVFGLHRVPKGGTIIIVEGELNVLALWQMGITNAVAINGSSFSDRQAKLIRSWAEKAIVYLDTDNAGDTGIELVCEKLRDYMTVCVVPDHEGDPADAIDTDPEKEHITEAYVRETIDDAESETKIRLMAKQSATIT